MAPHPEAKPDTGDVPRTEAAPQTGTAQDHVFLPGPETLPVRTVNAIGSLPGFVGAIISTMQSYRDNQQAEMPSYRERIVQVRLMKNEGGLNLDMPGPVLNEVAGYGKDAADALLKFDMPGHQWTRLRVLMGQLEAELDQMDERLTMAAGVDEGKATDEELRCAQLFPAAYLLRKQQETWQGNPPTPPLPFPPTADDWCGKARAILDQMAGITANWGVGVFQDSALIPPASLRVSPFLYAARLGAGDGAGPDAEAQ